MDLRLLHPACADTFRVRDQGQCGNCYAYSTVQMLEQRYCIQGGIKTPLSVQWVTDCSGLDSGCEGGEPLSVLDFLANEGTVAEACLPKNRSKLGQSFCHKTC